MRSLDLAVVQHVEVSFPASTGPCPQAEGNGTSATFHVDYCLIYRTLTLTVYLCAALDMDSRRSYLTPAGATGDSTLSKRNALLGSSSTGSDSHLNLSDPYGNSYNDNSNAYANGGYGNISRSNSPYGRPSSSNSQYASQRTAEDLESQNEEELEGLGAKVKMLKDVRLHLNNVSLCSDLTDVVNCFGV